jgi:large subunit ribosomal protein L15
MRQVVVSVNGGIELTMTAGKRILVLQGTQVLLTSQAPPPPSTDTYNREPFNHPSLEALPKVQAVDLGDVLSKQRVGQLARSYGIDRVTRWKPRNVRLHELPYNSEKTISNS